MRRLPTPDLFGEGNDARAEAPEAGDGGIEAGAEARKPDVSIEAFAKLQRSYYLAGMASATAYWKARGITWPRS